MKTLLHERFAPITTSVGYIRASVDEVVGRLVDWREAIGRRVQVTELSVAWPECLHRLEPLTGGASPRELVVSTGGEWTAYFDCSIRGTDAATVIGHLTWKFAYEGVTVRTNPHTYASRSVEHGRFGSIQFEMFGPQNDGLALSSVRNVAVAYVGKGWAFVEGGTPQPFEEVDNYSARRVRERFTTQMLSDYCSSLGIDVFNEAAYGPRAVLIETDEPQPNPKLEMSLAETQRWLEITPGLTDALQG